MKQYDIVIIGGGPAGLAAAIAAKKKGIKDILVLERDRELGGILQQCIHNGFGLHIFKEELTGPEYAQRFIEELMVENIEYRLDTMVLDIQPDQGIHAINAVEGLMHIKAKAIILAMGCRERTAGAINIPGTRPAGVFTAGTAQRFINMEGYMVGKKVVILGSGDIGLIMARRMTLEGAQVLAVAEILPYSSGLTRNIVQCLEDFNIPLYFSHTITQVRGKNRVEGVTISRVDENRHVIPHTEIEFECDTLLLSVGLIPENEISRAAGVMIDTHTNGPLVNASMQTTIPSVFACGNVVQVHDLVDFVTLESRRAGEGAAQYVKGLLPSGTRSFTTKPESGITYIVPQKIDLENLGEEVQLFFRVKQVSHDAKLVIKTDGHILKEIKRRHLAPGEMETILLTKAELELSLFSELTIEAKGGE